MRVNGAAAATAAGSTRSRPGLTIRKPLVMGTYAFRLSQAEKRRHNDMTHKWTCLLRSPDGEDLTYFIKKVVFELDPSFVNPRRTLTSPPYEVSEAGWGEFYLTARIYLVDETLPPVEMMHFLRTYDELLIYEPADWLYEKLTATPVTDAPPHPLSPYFMQPSDSEEKQLQLYLGLQGYVQTESIALMQEAFLLTLQIQELQRQHEAITKGGGGAAAGAGAGAAAAAATSEGDGGEDAAAAAPGTPGPSGGFAAAVPDVAAVSGRPAAAGFGPSLGPVALTAQASPVSRGASIAAPAAYGSPKSPQLAAGPDPQQQPHVLPSIQPPQQHLMQQHQQHQMLQQQQLLQQQQQHMLQQQQHHMMQQQQHYLPKPPPHPAAPTQQQQQVLQQQQMG